MRVPGILFSAHCLRVSIANSAGNARLRIRGVRRWSRSFLLEVTLAPARMRVCLQFAMFFAQMRVVGMFKLHFDCGAFVLLPFGCILLHVGDVSCHVRTAQM